MVIRVALSVLIFMGFIGCSSSIAREKYLVTDHDKIANAFIESTREYYAGRKDGTLQEPTMAGDLVHFIYRYALINKGQFAEQVDLEMHEARLGRPGVPKENVPAYFEVKTYFQQDGPDPEAPAVRDAIVAGMHKRLGDFQLIP